jgi:hypothetical protein
MVVHLNNHIVRKWRCFFTLFPIDTSTLDLAVSLESCHDSPLSMPQPTPSFFIKSRNAVSQSTCRTLKTPYKLCGCQCCDLCVCSEPIVVIGIPNGHQTKERAFKKVCYFICMHYYRWENCHVRWSQQFLDKDEH